MLDLDFRDPSSRHSGEYPTLIDLPEPGAAGVPDYVLELIVIKATQPTNRRADPTTRIRQEPTVQPIEAPKPPPKPRPTHEPCRWDGASVCGNAGPTEGWWPGGGSSTSASGWERRLFHGWTVRNSDRTAVLQPQLMTTVPTIPVRHGDLFLSSYPEYMVHAL